VDVTWSLHGNARRGAAAAEQPDAADTPSVSVAVRRRRVAYTRAAGNVAAVCVTVLSAAHSGGVTWMSSRYIS
jgi:hypothetical protein